MKSRPHKHLRMAALTVATLATLVLCYLSLSDVKPGRVWSALGESDLWWLIPATLAMAASLVARAVRWRVLFSPATRPPLSDVTRAMLLGYFFNSILPVRAGEAARIVSLKRRAATSQSETLGTILLDRAYDLAAVVVLFFAASPWLPDTHWGGRGAAMLAAGLAVVLVSTGIVLAVFGDRAFSVIFVQLSRLPWLSRERMEVGAANFARGLAGLRDARLAFSASLWTLLSWPLTGLSCWFVLVGFHLGLSPLAGLLVALAIGLAMVLPAPPGALGVVEAAAVLALRGYGVDPSEAFSSALALHAVNLVPFLVIGPLLLSFEVRSSRGRAAEASGVAAETG